MTWRPCGEHLCLDRMDLLAHSAAANLAALYVAQRPERVSKLL
jgi:proline iminopeptidase